MFDDPNLVASAGLVPVMGLAQEAGLEELARQHLSVPGDKGANAGLKVASLVAGMVAGADSIDDMALLRHGGMGRLFAAIYAPSTLGSFLRAFAFGHVRQLDAVASRFLLALAALTRLVRSPRCAADGHKRRGFAFVDVDDTVIEVHGHHKQGAGFGYTKVRGLNALLATATTPGAAPVIVAQRLRRGGCSSPRGGKRLVADAVTTTRRLLEATTPVLVRMDSAFYGRGPVHAALAGGAQVSVTVRADARVKAAIASIAEDAWTSNRVHRRGLRRDLRAVDLPRRGRRDRVHRVRRPTEVRPGARPADRAPDTGLPGRQAPRSGAGRAVRRLAIPRVLHHHRPDGARPWLPTRSTVGTRSSNRSTPT